MRILVKKFIQETLKHHHLHFNIDEKFRRTNKVRVLMRHSGVINDNVLYIDEGREGIGSA